MTLLRVPYKLAFSFLSLVKIILILIPVIVMTMFFGFALSDTGSMEPTLDGSMVFGINFVSYGFRLPFSDNYLVRFNEIEKGNVVIFKDPFDKTGTEPNLVKRVIATPGDTIAIVNRHLIINGKKIDCVNTKVINDKNSICEQTLGDTSYTLKHHHEFSETQGQLEEFTMPSGYFFVMGDNREASFDSRYFGLIAEDDVLGSLVFTYPKLIHYSLVLIALLLLAIYMFMTEAVFSDNEPIAQS